MALKGSQLTSYKDGVITEEGTNKVHPRFQKWLDVLYEYVVRRQKVIDLTNATSDYKLKVGECAKVTITAASTALHVAVEDGVYEIKMLFDSATFAADQTIELQANNTTYVGEFLMITLAGDTAIATDEVDTATGNNDSFVFGGASRPRVFSGSLTISGLLSGLEGTFYAVVAGNSRIRLISTWRSGSVAHTILGTLLTGEAANGVVYIRRTA